MTEHHITVPRQGRWHMRLRRLAHLDRRWSVGVALADNPRESDRTEYWVTRAATHLGDSWVWGIVAVVLWRNARPERSTWARRTVHPRWLTRGRADVAGWFLALTATTGLVMALKNTVRRVRPDSDHLLYGGGPDKFSFPSGHAARMGVLAVWGWRYGRGVGALVGLLALLVSWSRVRLRIHYLSDVLAGLAIGVALGWVAWLGREQLAPPPAQGKQPLAHLLELARKWSGN